MSSDHQVPGHYGVRTKTHKLIYYYGKALGSTGTSPIDTPPEWELFDLVKDPGEMNSVYGQPAYANVTATLKQELARLQQQYKDQPCE
jgi:choline-sulfatase